MRTLANVPAVHQPTALTEPVGKAVSNDYRANKFLGLSTISASTFVLLRGLKMLFYCNPHTVNNYRMLKLIPRIGPVAGAISLVCMYHIYMRKSHPRDTAEIRFVKLLSVAFIVVAIFLDIFGAINMPDCHRSLVTHDRLPQIPLPVGLP